MGCKITIIPNQGPNKGNRVTSELFEQVLEMQPDPIIAEREYNKIYEDDFVNKFGDWVEDFKSVEGRVDLNGEPKVILQDGMPMFEGIDGKLFQAFIPMQL